MAATYVLDLAFDVNQDKEYQEIYFPLQAGLVDVTDFENGTGQPQWLTRLQSNDRLHFRIWDFSEVDDGTTLLNVWVAFFDPQSWQLANVLATQANPLVCTDLFAVSSPVETSVFTPVRGGWLLGENTSPLGQAFTISAVSAPTRFVLQVRIQVETPAGTLRTYIYDPEVVVGPNGT